jgi:hypothetical protein
MTTTVYFVDVEFRNGRDMLISTETGHLCLLPTAKISK